MCDYCNGDNMKSHQDHDFNEVGLNKDLSGWSLWIATAYGSFAETKVYYCPWCGRRL